MKMVKKRRKELKATGNFIYLLKTIKDNYIYIIVCSTQPWVMGMSYMLKHCNQESFGPSIWALPYLKKSLPNLT